MFVTNAEQRAGLLVAVISGGRPRMDQRPTHKMLADLQAHGFTQICWVVRADHAAEYETDQHEIVTYTDEWARDYAQSHWMSTDPLPPAGGFLGAFVGREWACREAERRGCWGVLQLDDNIVRATFVRNIRAGVHLMSRPGGIATAIDLLSAVTLSTNSRMTGAQLTSIPHPDPEPARPGFPYSMFIEQVGEGREEWYGPFEDDITHAFQYGTRGDMTTAALVPLIQYMKESKSTTGMRKHYNHTRALQLQRIFPESAKINVRKTKSNGLGGPRVFHTMTSGAIRNPLLVQNRAMYQAFLQSLGSLVAEFGELEREFNRDKMRQRIQQLRGS